MRRKKKKERQPQGPSRRPSFERQDEAVCVLFSAGFSILEIARFVRGSDYSVGQALRAALTYRRRTGR